MTRRLISLAAVAVVCLASLTQAKTQMAKGWEFPAGEAVTMITLRPDVTVGSLDAGGLEEPNADWTSNARANLAEAIQANQTTRGYSVVTLPEQLGDNAKVVDQYQKLFRAVSAAIYLHKFTPFTTLPTKKDSFDWTLGPGAAKLGEIGGGNYALFLYTHDSFGSSGRKALQVMGILGCGVGVCVIVPGGVHFYYASLVDLRSGDVVWFNFVPHSEGDIRTPGGAQGLVDKLFATMPIRRAGTGGKT